MRFEWDARKASANIRKHGIGFDEAQTVFFDENAIEYDDPDHSKDEERLLMLGLSSRLRLLVVSYCYRAQGSVFRLISARKATRNEREAYSEGAK